MSEDSMNKVVTILDKQLVCIQHEIADRAWINYKLRFPIVNKAIDKLNMEKTITYKPKDSPYGKDFHFYYLSGANEGKVDELIKYKLDLLWKHSDLTNEIGRFGELLVAKIAENLGYTEIEIRKEKHGDIGFGRREMDVFAKHVFDYYQHIEVKNRRQPVNLDDIENLDIKTRDANELWDLPIESALVCAFIYETARKKAESKNIPVVITRKIYIPEKFAYFYEEYSTALGSYYMELTNGENPPKHLVRKIMGIIRAHDYKK